MHPQVEFIYLEHKREKPEEVAYCLSTLKKHMPEAFITQISDRYTDKIPGVDAVVRISNTKIEFNKVKYPQLMFDCLAQHSSDNSLVIDTDLVFDDSIYETFEGDYDVALCSRCDNDAPNLQEETPYQGGLWIVKNTDFWSFCSTLHSKLPKYDWKSGQLLISEMVKNKTFNFKVLDGNIYNRTPRYEGETDPNVKVWHYKGKRKKWLPLHARSLD